MKHLGLWEQLRIERRKNAELQAKLSRNRADTDYIAMMADIDLDSLEKEEVSGDE